MLGNLSDTCSFIAMAVSTIVTLTPRRSPISPTSMAHTLKVIRTMRNSGRMKLSGVSNVSRVARRIAADRRFRLPEVVEGEEGAGRQPQAVGPGDSPAEREPEREALCSAQSAGARRSPGRRPQRASLPDDRRRPWIPGLQRREKHQEFPTGRNTVRNISCAPRASVTFPWGTPTTWPRP